MTPEELLRELREPDYWQDLRVPRVRHPARIVRRIDLARVLPGVAALVVAVLAVAGIGIGFASLHRAGVPAATTSTPTVISSPTPVPAFSGVTAGSTRTYDSAHVPPACTLAQLQTASKQDGTGTGGDYRQYLHVHNAGSDCLLQSDVVEVGGKRIAPSQPIGGSLEHVPGSIWPAGGTGDLLVSALDICSGHTRNLDVSNPVLPITLRIGSTTRVMTAKFPRTSCFGPAADPIPDPGDVLNFPSVLPLTGTTQVSAQSAVEVRYRVTVRNSGSSALILRSCPTVTEVLEDEPAQTIVRTLALHCAVGTTIQPDVASSFDVTVPVINGARKSWLVSWFVVGGSATPAPSTTCIFGDLSVATSGISSDASTYREDLEIRNTGATCFLPLTAISVNGTSPNPAAGAQQIVAVPAGASRIRLEAPARCPNGKANMFASAGGPPVFIFVRLGGVQRTLHAASDANETASFPSLVCGGLTAYRVP